MKLMKSYSYIIRYTLLVCFFFLAQFCFLIHAQRVRSEKTSINIKSLIFDEKNFNDTTTPLLKIISPDFHQEEKIKSHLPEITIYYPINTLKATNKGGRVMTFYLGIT